MLPEFPPNLGRLPRPLKLVRVLEEFEGPILSEYHAEGGGVYLMKLCAREVGIRRVLVVRTEQRALAEYLGGMLTMLELLTGPSDGAGFIVDFAGRETNAVYLVNIAQLPAHYLPKRTARHDEDLRPVWGTIPHSFLLDRWNAKRLADLERLYLNIASFTYLTEPESERKLPAGIFGYTYDRGYPIANAFAAMRASVPRESRARSVGVSASSPGVLTMDAPARVAERVEHALSAIPESKPEYREIHTWSRSKPDKADERMPDLGVAVAQVTALCDSLDVARTALLAKEDEGDPLRVLVAAKLITAYWRQLARLLRGKGGAFIGLKSATPESDDLEDDEDDI